MNHLSLSQKEIDIEINILSLGKILVNRSFSKQENDAILSILSDLGIDEKDVKEFFDIQNSIENIVGDDPLCG